MTLKKQAYFVVEVDSRVVHSLEGNIMVERRKASASWVFHNEWEAKENISKLIRCGVDSGRISVFTE